MRRFGVSLPKEVAEALEKLSKELGVTRSEVVASALVEYLEARRSHSEAGHQCLGVLLALSDGFIDLGDITEENRDAIVAYTHLHIEGKCLTVAVVKGDGVKIEKLTISLSKNASVVRYVPLL